MKKTILFLTLLLASFTFVSCDKEESAIDKRSEKNDANIKGSYIYSLDESKELASLFYKELKGIDNVKLRSGGNQDAVITNTYTINVLDSLELYAFNFKDNGFVIINPIKRIQSRILAYSDDKNISETFLNSGIFSIWKDYTMESLIYSTSQTKQGLDTRATNSAPSLDANILNKRMGSLTNADYVKINEYIKNSNIEKVIRQPIISTKWSQRAPYNNLCPNNYPAGCVAISVGQIINYHKFWKNKVWDWSKINNSQTPDISQFIKEIGNGVKMDYGKDGSHPDWANLNLITDLNYREVTFLRNIGYSASSYNLFDNEERAYKEIDAGRPIVMCGFKKEIIIPLDGHSWVADGIKTNTFKYIMDEDQAMAVGISHPAGYDALFLRDLLTQSTMGYYHFNMGWGGTDDGWFLAAYGKIMNLDNYNRPFEYNKHLKFVAIKK